MSEAKKVRCSECGLLSISPVGNHSLVEVPQEFRKGKILPEFAPFPVCPMGVCNFYEIREHSQHPDNAVISEMVRPRECSEFLKWIPGMPPKEIIHMNVLERQRRWQQDMMDRDDEWKKAERFRDNLWRGAEVLFAGLVVGVLTVVVQLYISRETPKPIEVKGGPVEVIVTEKGKP